MSLLQLFKQQNPLIDHAISLNDYTYALQLIDETLIQPMDQTKQDILTLTRIYCLYQLQQYHDTDIELVGWSASITEETDPKAKLFAEVLKKALVITGRSTFEHRLDETFSLDHLEGKILVSMMAINFLLTDLETLADMDRLWLSLFISQLMRYSGQFASFHSIRAGHMQNIALFLPQTVAWVEHLLTGNAIHPYFSTHWTAQQKKALSQLIMAADNYHQELIKEGFYHTAEIFYVTQLNEILPAKNAFVAKKKHRVEFSDLLSCLSKDEYTLFLLHAAKLFTHHNNNQALAIFLYAKLLTHALKIKHKITISYEISRQSEILQQMAMLLINYPIDGPREASIVFRLGSDICDLMLAHLKPHLETLQTLIDKLIMMRPDDPEVQLYHARYCELIQKENTEQKWQQLMLRFPDHQEIIESYFNIMLQRYISPIASKETFQFEKAQQIIFDLNLKMQYFPMNRRLIILRSLAVLAECSLQQRFIPHQFLEPFEANHEIFDKANDLFPLDPRFHYCRSWIYQHVESRLGQFAFSSSTQDILQEPKEFIAEQLRYPLLKKIYALELCYTNDILDFLQQTKTAIPYYHSAIYPSFSPDSCRMISQLGMAARINGPDKSYPTYRSTGLHHQLFLQMISTEFNKKRSLEFGTKIQSEEYSPHPFFTCETTLVFLPTDPMQSIATIHFAPQFQSEQDACLRILRPLSDLAYTKNMYAFVMRTLYYISKGFYAPREVIAVLQNYTAVSIEKLDQAHIQAARNYALFSDQESKIYSSEKTVAASKRFLTALMQYQLTSSFLGYAYKPSTEELGHNLTQLNLIRLAHLSWRNTFNVFATQHSKAKEEPYFQFKISYAPPSSTGQFTQSIQLAEQALFLRDYTTALKYYQAAEAISALNINAILLKAYCLAMLGHLELVLELLDTLPPQAIPSLEEMEPSLTPEYEKTDHFIFLRLHESKKVIYLRAYCLLKTGRVTEAASVLFRSEEYIYANLEMMLLLSESFHEIGFSSNVEYLLCHFLLSLSKRLLPDPSIIAENTIQKHLKAIQKLPEIVAHGKNMPAIQFSFLLMTYLHIFDWYAQHIIEYRHFETACQFYEIINQDILDSIFAHCPENLFNLRLNALRAFAKAPHLYANALDQTSNHLAKVLLPYGTSRTVSFRELTTWLIETPPQQFDDPEIQLHAFAITRTLNHIYRYDICHREHAKHLSNYLPNDEKSIVTYESLSQTFTRAMNKPEKMKQFYQQLIKQRQTFPVDREYLLLELAYYLYGLKNTQANLPTETLSKHPAIQLIRALITKYPDDVNTVYACFTASYYLENQANIDEEDFFLLQEHPQSHITLAKEHHTVLTHLPSLIGLLCQFASHRHSIFNYDQLITSICLKNVAAMQIMEKFNDHFLVAPGILFSHFTDANEAEELFLPAYCQQINVILNPRTYGSRFHSPLYSFQALYLMQTATGCLCIDPLGYARTDYENRVLRLIANIDPAFLVSLPSQLLEILFYQAQGFTPVETLAEALNTVVIKNPISEKEKEKLETLMQNHFEYLSHHPEMKNIYLRLLDQYGLRHYRTASHTQYQSLKLTFTNPYLAFISYDTLSTKFENCINNTMPLTLFSRHTQELCDAQQESLLALEQDSVKREPPKQKPKKKNKKSNHHKNAPQNMRPPTPIHNLPKKNALPLESDQSQLEAPEHVQFYFNQFNEALGIQSFPGKFWLVGSSSLCIARNISLEKSQDLDFVLQCFEEVPFEMIKFFLIKLGFVPTLKHSVFVREDELAHLEIYISPFVEKDTHTFLMKDISTRDFTIGAIYYDGARIENPVWGLEDYDTKYLTMITPANNIAAQTAMRLLEEDPRRVLRAFKLMIRYQLIPDMPLDNALQNAAWRFQAKNPKHQLMQTLLIKAFNYQIVRMSPQRREKYLKLIKQYKIAHKLPCLKDSVAEWTAAQNASTNGMNRLALPFYPSPPVFWDNRRSIEQKNEMPLSDDEETNHRDVKITP